LASDLLVRPNKFSSLRRDDRLILTKSVLAVLNILHGRNNTRHSTTRAKTRQWSKSV